MRKVHRWVPNSALEIQCFSLHHFPFRIDTKSSAGPREQAQPKHEDSFGNLWSFTGNDVRRYGNKIIINGIHLHLYGPTVVRDLPAAKVTFVEAS